MFLLFILEHCEWRAPYGQFNSAQNKNQAQFKLVERFFKPSTHVTTCVDVMQREWVIRMLKKPTPFLVPSLKAPVNSFIWVELYCKHTKVLHRS